MRETKIKITASNTVCQRYMVYSIDEGQDEGPRKILLSLSLFVCASLAFG